MKLIKNYELRITNYHCGQTRLHRYAKHCGQVGLIILIMSSLVMVVGLTISRRTVSQTKIDTNLEQYKQAFNAAESGMEAAVQTEQSGSRDYGKAKAVYTIGTTEIKNGNEYSFVGTEADIDINNYLGDINICTKNNSDFLLYYFGNMVTQKSILNSCKLVSTSAGDKYISVRLIKNIVDTITIEPRGSNIGVTRATSTGFYDKNNAKGVKVIVSANRTFKIPSFLLEPVVAVGAILP